jgi:hypothetical protein
MAIVSKNDQNPDPGAAPPKPDGDGAGEAAPQQTADAGAGAAAPREVRHNLPLKAAPIVGRKPEMQRVVGIFETIRKEGRPRRVEVVGRAGVGASTVAIELARRAGHRFPGGAWYVNLDMGADLAWAQLGAMRDGKPVKRLADAARAARERLGEEPKALLVVDGAKSAEQATAALPPTTKDSADVFVVAEAPLATVDADQVCEVSPVPRHAARRMAQSMIRQAQPDARPPAVRTLDGLAVTASLAARVALAFQGKEGPLSFDDTRAAMQRIVRLVARNAASLELLILASVGHPVGMPVDVLYGALAHVRAGRGAAPTPEEAGQGVMWLAHAGIVEPMDERRFSMHPLLQEIVRGMTQTPADIEVARTALVAGAVAEAEASISADGVDVPRAALHQLRFLASTATGDAKTKAQAAVDSLHAALGVEGAAG